jgi:hypothetical protein
LGADSTAQAPTDAAKEMPKPSLKTMVHEILIRNQLMSLDPPLEHARVNWISQLHAWLSMYSHFFLTNMYKASSAIYLAFRALDMMKDFHTRETLPRQPMTPSVISSLSYLLDYSKEPTIP